MFELIYASRVVPNLDQSQMQTFLEPGRARNAACGLTGLLLHLQHEPADQSFFDQLLEGPRSAVEQTYDRIGQDARHTDLAVVHQGHRDLRSFKDWPLRLATMSTEALHTLVGPTSPPPSATGIHDLIQDPFLARALLVIGADSVLHQESNSRSNTTSVGSIARKDPRECGVGSVVSEAFEAGALVPVDACR